MNNVLVQLGGFVFSIKTTAYHSTKTTKSYNWPELNRIGGIPALQYTGEGNETMSLDGVIFPKYSGGLGQIHNLKKEAEKKTPLNLVSSNGVDLGDWVIVSISNIDNLFLPGGYPQKIEFNINLKKYGDDKNHGAKGRISL